MEEVELCREQQSSNRVAEGARIEDAGSDCAAILNINKLLKMQGK